MHIRIRTVRSRAVAGRSQRRVFVIFPFPYISRSFPLDTRFQVTVDSPEPTVPFIFQGCGIVQLLGIYNLVGKVGVWQFACEEISFLRGVDCGCSDA